MPGPDFIVTNHGTIFTVAPQNESARAHLEENVQPDAQWFHGSLVVEHRYAAALVDGLLGDGWKVE